MQELDIKKIIHKFESTESLTDFEVLHLLDHYKKLDQIIQNDQNLKVISFYCTTRLIKVQDMFDARLKSRTGK